MYRAIQAQLLFRKHSNSEITNKDYKTEMLRRESSELKSHLFVRRDSGIESSDSLEKNMPSDHINFDTDTVQQNLCKISDLQNGEKREFVVELNGENQTIILLIKDYRGKFYAVGKDCTYCGNPLINGVLSHNKIRCSVHGTAFNIKTGKLEDLPGFDSLPSFGIKLSESDVYLVTNPTRLAHKSVIDPMSKCKDSISDPVVIIGGGIAGMTCAETLRHEGFSGRIIMITREVHLPYNRSLLTKEYRRKLEEVRFRDEDFFKTHDIELFLATKVKSIDVEEKILICDDEKKMTFSSLVLAMGSKNRATSLKNASELEGIIQMRDVNDFKTVVDESVKKHVTVVGSGYAALEISSLISKCARSVTILCKNENLLKQFGPYFGRDLRPFIDDQGKVSIRQGASIRSLEGFDRVDHLVLKDGLCVVANTVIICNGVQPCTSILLGSKIHTDANGHVIVDENMQSNHPHIFAIGDLAEFPMTIFGNQRCAFQHVQPAQYQARIAAKIIAGKTVQHDFVPFFWIDLFEKHITFCGDCLTVPDDKIIRGTLINGDYRCYTFKNDEVISVVDSSTKFISVQFIDIFKNGIKISKQEVEKFVFLNKFFCPN